MRAISQDQIKRIETDILREFAAICESHGLRYCLAYGTCLGAVRHGGFIPWDDDIDVYMPRDDYERFFTLIQSGDVSSRYKLRSYRDGSSYHPHFKFVDSSTISYESYIDKKYSIGLWIDIFPLEIVEDASDPSVRRAFVMNKRLRSILEILVGDKSSGTTLFAAIAKRMLYVFFARKDPMEVSRIIDENASSLSTSFLRGENPERRGSLVDVIESRGDDVYAFDYDDIFPTVNGDFEGMKLPIPRQFEGYLTRCYGDWSALPPEKERRLHHSAAFYLDES